MYPLSQQIHPALLTGEHAGIIPLANYPLFCQVNTPADYQLLNQEYVTEEEIRERPEEVYEAEEDYHGRADDELTFLRGAIIKNVEQDLDHVGWWVYNHI